MLSVLVAIVCVALGILGIVAFNGTPHGGPTSVCSPVSLFGSVFSVPFDCRVLTWGEIIFIAVCFLLAVMAALAARPSRVA